MSAITNFFAVGRKVVQSLPSVIKTISNGIGYLRTGKKVAESLNNTIGEIGFLAEKVNRVVNHPFVANGLNFVNDILIGHEKIKNHKVTQLTAKACEEIETKPNISKSEIILKTALAASAVLLPPESIGALGLTVAYAAIGAAAPLIDRMVDKYFATSQP
jgi:hypothetical protein